MTDQKKQIKIRIEEIDTPERKQPWGNLAKQALSDLTFQKRVTVKPVTIDRYGRTVAHILAGGISVSHELVRTGNDWVYRNYMKNMSFLDLEAAAKASKRGIWGLPVSQQVPLWEWRRSKRK